MLTDDQKSSFARWTHCGQRSWSRRRVRTGVLVCMALFFALSGIRVYAAEVAIVCRLGCEYHITGQIVRGDFDKFRKLLLQKKYSINYVMLNSPGGDVEEALRIAGLIRDAYLYTGVWTDIGSNTWSEVLS